jgi:hypothetical protein
MGRPKKRIDGSARFEIGERVIWKSGKKWKSGSIIFRTRNKKELLTNIPKGYKLQYSDKENEMSETKALTYLVAADSPLFKPGFTVHSIPERHIQKEKESWVWKVEQIEKAQSEENNRKNLLKLAIEVARTLHTNKRKVPETIKKIFYELYPELKSPNE